jgi:nicotinic acid mononucleotide adenylyltransferase
MEFFHRAPGAPVRLGILPGAFNPVTTAHMALAEAGLGRVDEVLFVLPRELPHKEFTGASFAQRMEMLRLALKGKSAFSLASSEGGLFLEIAAECRREYGAGVRLWFLCGRDAAERIAAWDYGEAGAFTGMLRGFGLLVAGRRGSYAPPAGFGEAIRGLELAGGHDAVSATAVRQGIARGERGELMVPAAAREMALGIYRSRAGWADPGTLRLGPD